MVVLFYCRGCSQENLPGVIHVFGIIYKILKVGVVLSARLFRFCSETRRVVLARLLQPTCFLVFDSSSHLRFGRRPFLLCKDR